MSNERCVKPEWWKRCIKQSACLTILRRLGRHCGKMMDFGFSVFVTCVVQAERKNPRHCVTFWNCLLLAQSGETKYSSPEWPNQSALMPVLEDGEGDQCLRALKWCREQSHISQTHYKLAQCVGIILKSSFQTWVFKGLENFFLSTTLIFKKEKKGSMKLRDVSSPKTTSSL